MESYYEQKLNRKNREYKYYGGYCSKCRANKIEPEPFHKWVETFRKEQLERSSN